MKTLQIMGFAKNQIPNSQLERRTTIMKKCYVLLLLISIILIGCGHTQSHKVGLMSFGDLEGKTILNSIDGNTVEGENCGRSYYLSNAVRDALKERDDDTLIDAEVTNSTGLFVWSNCIKVKGKAINSKKLSNTGGN